MTNKVKRTQTNFGLNALVWKENDLFVAKAIEVEVTSQGKTRVEALSNLREALGLYFEDEKIPVEKIIPLSLLELHKLTPNFRYA